MVSIPLTKLIKGTPLRSLQAHMRVVLDCAREVPPLFEALSREDDQAFNEIKGRIFEKEAEADKIKNAMRVHLPKSLFMPVDRRDLLDILQMQDSIADTAQDIAGLLIERPMKMPEPMVDAVLELSRRCVDVCEFSLKVIEELDELLEMGFKGKEANQVEAMVDELNGIEDETDELGIEAARILFRIEDDINPVSVIMWYRIIEWIGDLADYAEKVGDRMRLLIAR